MWKTIIFNTADLLVEATLTCCRRNRAAGWASLSAPRPEVGKSSEIIQPLSVPFVNLFAFCLCGWFISVAFCLSQNLFALKLYLVFLKTFKACSISFQHMLWILKPKSIKDRIPNYAKSRGGGQEPFLLAAQSRMDDFFGRSQKGWMIPRTQPPFQGGTNNSFFQFFFEESSICQCIFNDF